MREIGLFERLKASCADSWQRYIRHDFIRQLGAGTLPKTAFRHYLSQDYIFLIHFSRAYALAAYKSENLREIRQAAETVTALAGHEMQLHISYCSELGISEVELEKTPEAAANLAYTRFVLERGQAGDLLDLHVALSPCVIGYAEIGQWLGQKVPATLSDHPYGKWIEMYSGDEYQAVASSAVTFLNQLDKRRGGDARFDSLAKNFKTATELEIGFWQMGLDAT